ncbi:Potassium transporter 4 [Camellia lanceoleosa]|uniref:Potassium transporter 4 n=1 Tax=Camellia lanceoleosa TaxID=1840588 RepID=A0ACC0FDE0_9ERIC|nr:Potassium transporter 4 [Camellia lanceoleosa]
MLAYQSFGVIYGDLSTSPLYVYKSTFVGKLQKYQNEGAIFGAFLLICWTLMLIPLLKYVFIVLTADDNGEGGTFALYSLLCRHAKLSLLPNQQVANEELSAYKYGPSRQGSSSLPLKRFLEKHKKLRTTLLIVVLLGACMVIGDSLLCLPIVIIRLISIFAIGLYDTIYWNLKIVYAISPHYIIKLVSDIGKDGWILLGGILHPSQVYGICALVPCTKAMFADLGHFTLAFAFVVYPCLVVQYMGQAAFLSRNIFVTPRNPLNLLLTVGCLADVVFWIVFIIATLAAIVGSQTIITTTFSIVKQCHAHGCFPRIPKINWILMIVMLAVTIGFHDTTLIGNIYGKSILLASVFLLFFGFIEGVYLSSALMKVLQGGWVSLVLSFIFMYNFDLHNKVPLHWLLGLGPSLGIVRVPGIGLVYSELEIGVPAIFSHFVTNLPAFHALLVFVHVKSVSVPHVSSEERFLIGCIFSRPYRMYRCIVRYGHKDIQRDDGDFENQLIQCVAEFILMEAIEPTLSSSDRDSASFDGRMAIISTRTIQSSLCSIVSEEELLDLIQAKEAGVAYIIGHSYVKARRSSSFLNKLVIDIRYSFL